MAGTFTHHVVVHTDQEGHRRAAMFHDLPSAIERVVELLNEDLVLGAGPGGLDASELVEVPVPAPGETLAALVDIAYGEYLDHDPAELLELSTCSFTSSDPAPRLVG